MSNFNELLKRDGFNTIVTRFFNKVDSFNPKYKITDLGYKIVEEAPQPASYYVENNLTASHKVEISYTLNGDKSSVYHASFEIPKEIDGVFIIGGAYRIATNALEGDFDCRITMDGIGEHQVHFDYNRWYDIDKRILKVRRNNELNPKVSERPIEIKYENIDGLTGEKKELLKLTETQSKKLQIKLDLPYKPEYINTQLIEECLAFGDDRVKDLVVDKKINSVYTSFMNFIFRSGNGRNYRSARANITSNFTKNNKVPEDVTVITTLAFRYFKGTSEKQPGENNLQVPPGINAINLESMGSKVTIPETVAYNTTFSDIIDLADTPINNNTNKQNSLTVSTHITEDGIMFDVYTKDFQKVTIPYLDYLNSKVCASEYVDYHTNTLKPNESGEVEVKYRMKRKMVKVEEIDLIDLHPDYRLSSTTRQIPFVNSTDSVRISMGCSMLSIILSNNIVICYVNLVKCWKPLKTNYSRFGHL